MGYPNISTQLSMAADPHSVLEHSKAVLGILVIVVGGVVSIWRAGTKFGHFTGSIEELAKRIGQLAASHERTNTELDRQDREIVRHGQRLDEQDRRLSQGGL